MFVSVAHGKPNMGSSKAGGIHYMAIDIRNIRESDNYIKAANYQTSYFECKKIGVALGVVGFSRANDDMC